MEAKKRMANFELLRLIAMFMVVTMHYLSKTEVLLALDVPAYSIQYVGTLLESFCIAAVNVYVLISGYFLIESRFKMSRVISLLCQIWFYSLLIPVILGLLGMETVMGKQGLYGLLTYLFPIETEHYWFATAYVILYLLTPLLNRAVKALSRQQLQMVIGLLLILFCGIKSISPVVFAFDNYGYDACWFICVYLIAAYCRLYGIPFLEQKKNALGVYLGCSVVIFGMTAGLRVLYQKTGLLAYYFTVPFHYNFILCLLGALGLFFAFSRLQMKSGKVEQIICFCGPLSFGVYLLHEHIDIRYVWYEWIRLIPGMSGVSDKLPVFLLQWFLSVLLVFVAGLLVDLLRTKLFASCVRLLDKTKLAGWIRKIDQTF